MHRYTFAMKSEPLLVDVAAVLLLATSCGPSAEDKARIRQVVTAHGNASTADAETSKPSWQSSGKRWMSFPTAKREARFRRVKSARNVCKQAAYPTCADEDQSSGRRTWGALN